jgi:hypothetical protein
MTKVSCLAIAFSCALLFVMTSSAWPADYCDLTVPTERYFVSEDMTPELQIKWNEYNLDQYHPLKFTFNPHSQCEILAAAIQPHFSPFRITFTCKDGTLHKKIIFTTAEIRARKCVKAQACVDNGFNTNNFAMAQAGQEFKNAADCPEEPEPSMTAGQLASLCAKLRAEYARETSTKQMRAIEERMGTLGCE